MNLPLYCQVIQLRSLSLLHSSPVTQFRKWFPGMDRFANASIAQKLKDRQGMLSAGKQVPGGWQGMLLMSHLPSHSLLHSSFPRTQVLFDIFVHMPFMYFPAFYTVKEFVQGTSNNPIDW